uniref:Uncharacterized protein n=1 Tax=Myoviridae sp. ctCo31 TaxID=2825053 RepID=A0A8S5UMC2_9CAUD|nr:MAG TPA: hypothetical protein [Myoviridae sp. ctCo31]
MLLFAAPESFSFTLSPALKSFINCCVLETFNGLSLLTANLISSKYFYRFFSNVDNYKPVSFAN